jgi:hypothetical protein
MKTILILNGSSYVSAIVILQYINPEVLYPVTFFSKIHLSAKENYTIYNQILVAIVSIQEQ